MIHDCGVSLVHGLTGMQTAKGTLWPTLTRESAQPSKQVDFLQSQAAKEQIAANREGHPRSVLRCMDLVACQSIALRGHLDFEFMMNHRAIFLPSSTLQSRLETVL